MITIVKCKTLKSYTLGRCSFPILAQKFTNKKLCGGVFGILLLLIFYVKKAHIETDCPFWAVCPLDHIEEANQLTEVIILPPVQPDRCVQTASMYKGMIWMSILVNCSVCSRIS